MVGSAELGLLAKEAISQHLNARDHNNPRQKICLGITSTPVNLTAWGITSTPANLIAWGITSTPKVRERRWGDRPPRPTDHRTATSSNGH